jgi:hypothetical protein
MPLTIPAGFAEATYRYTLAGDPQVMTVSVGVDHDGSVDAETLAGNLYVPMGVWVGSAWGSDYALTGVSVVMNVGGVLTEGEVNVITPGVAATNHPVQNTALLIRKVSGLAGRANRGRWYMPPGRLAEVDVNNFGLIDAVDLATIQGEVDSLLLDLETAGGVDNLVILHSEVPPGVPSIVPPTEITNLVVEQTVATQRRRLRG